MNDDCQRILHNWRWLITHDYPWTIQKIVTRNIHKHTRILMYQLIWMMEIEIYINKMRDVNDVQDEQLLILVTREEMKWLESLTRASLVYMRFRSFIHNIAFLRINLIISQFVVLYTSDKNCFFYRFQAICCLSPDDSARG